MSPDRKRFNEVWIPLLDRVVNNGSLIYDIGVGGWNYQNFLSNKKIKTIDRVADKHPDYVLNIEHLPEHILSKGDAVICTGVVEQCDNPFILIEKIHSCLLKDNGIALFSIILTGYNIPINDLDYLRFTATGAVKLLDKYFETISSEVFGDKNLPSSLFYIGRKI